MDRLTAEQILDLDDHRYRVARPGGLVCRVCGRASWLAADSDGYVVERCVTGHLVAVG